MIHAPLFGLGLGLDVHVRTKIRYNYSYIKSAAVKMADDVLEVSSYGDYHLNGVDTAKIDKSSMVGPFPLSYEAVSSKEHVFKIHISDEEMIQVRTFKDFVNVKFINASPDNFMDSVGLLGAYSKSKTIGASIARDGETVLEDPVAFGMEWQVRPEEPQLFEAPGLPTYPQQCRMPEPTTTSRRLGETIISQEVAEAACSHWSKDLQAHCVYDVMATGDIELAEAGAY